MTVIMDMGGEPYDVCEYMPSYCKVDNICNMMKTKIPPSVCPKSLVEQGFNCQCPVKKVSKVGLKFVLNKIINKHTYIVL